MGGECSKNLIKVFQVMEDKEMESNRFFNQIWEYQTW